MVPDAVCGQKTDRWQARLRHWATLETVMEGSTDSGGRPCAARATGARTVVSNMILETIFLNKQSIASP